MAKAGAARVKRSGAVSPVTRAKANKFPEIRPGNDPRRTTERTTRGARRPERRPGLLEVHGHRPDCLLAGSHHDGQHQHGEGDAGGQRRRVVHRADHELEGENANDYGGDAAQDVGAKTQRPG